MIKVRLPDGREVNVQTDDPEQAAKIAHGWSQKNRQATRTFTVTSPDGRKFTVQAPEGATKEEVLARAQSHARVNGGPGKADWKDNVGGLAGNFLDGILPGSSGFARGLREMAINAAQAPFSEEVDFRPIQSYNQGKSFQEQRNKRAQIAHPTANNVAQGAGILAGLALPAAKVAKVPNLYQKAKAGAKTAGLYGAASGAMTSDQDTIAGKADDALSSGLLAAGVGGALPVATRIAGAASAPLRPLTQPAIQMFGRGLQGLGDILPGSMGRVVASEGQQLARDPAIASANRELDRVIRAGSHPVTGEPLRPAHVAQEVERRQDLGVPAVAADLDEGVRSRFGSAARSAGPATMRVRQLVDDRKAQEAARTVQHIAGSLGPTGNVQGQAEALTQEAKRAAAPLFDLSDAQQIPLANELQELFSRPAGRKAIDAASLSLQNQGLSPVTDGLIQQADGSWIKGQVPTMQAYDHAKTHLDDMVFADRSAFATPEVRRDAAGATSIRARLLELMDGDGSGPRSAVPDVPQGPSGPSYAEQLGLPKAPPGPPNAPGPWTGQRLHPETETAGGSAIPSEGLNPYWKPARDAYAGPVQSRKALELGEEMAKGDAEDISQRLGHMSDSQRDFFRLGHRSGLADNVRTVPDYGDPAKRIAGSLGKREALAAAHGPEVSQALLDRLDPEQDASRTWKTVRGSPGTQQAALGAQDQRIEDAATGLIQTLAGHPGAGLGNIVSALARGDRVAPEVNGHIASVLAEPEVQVLKKAMRDVQRERARGVLVDRNADRVTQHSGRLLGSILGNGMIDTVEDEDAF